VYEICVSIYLSIYILLTVVVKVNSLDGGQALGAGRDGGLDGRHQRLEELLRSNQKGAGGEDEQVQVSLKLKRTVDAGVGRTFAVIIEGG